MATTQVVVRGSLDPRFYGPEGKIRLNHVRTLYRGDLISTDDVLEAFQEWVSTDEGLLLERARIVDGIEVAWDYFGAKASKRGNDVYSFRVKDRLNDLLQFADENDVVFFQKFNRGEKGKKTRCLFVSLTYDSKRCSAREAWENIGIEYNRFLSDVRSKFGRIHHFRVWESFESAYPHLHALILFEDSEFDVWKDNSDEYRIQQKREFDSMWHSFIDVSAVRVFSQSVRYLVKYLTKTHDMEDSWVRDHSSKALKTLALCWVNRKRSFSLSSDLVSKLKEFRVHDRLHNSRIPFLVQADLEGKPAESYVWRVLGIVSWSRILEKRKDPSDVRWHYALKEAIRI